ncbi:MAG: hypothetical protein Q7T71_13000, partial [Herbiconiux sp.]|nr:hypothetical protein [Herbiconiux sp.]
MRTTSARAVTGLVGLVSALALTACGGSDDRVPERESAAPTSTGTTQAPARKRPAAPTAEAVRAALTELDTGRYRVRLDLGSATLTRKGVFRIEDSAGSGTATYDLGDGRGVSVRTLTVDDIAYGQVDNGSNVRMAPCWWRYDTYDLNGL